MILHGGLIAMRIAGYWRGLLIEGPSGAGKSDLALRALDHGFRLVADDRVVAFVVRGRLYGRSPDPLAGLLEVRGLGITRQVHLPFARIVLAVRCVERADSVDRLPEFGAVDVLGLSLPCIEVWPFEPAAPNKLCNAIERLGVGSQQEYQTPFAAPKERSGA